MANTNIAHTARWQYRVTQPRLPPFARTSPVMDHKDMEWWMNDMDEQGWEFVGFGAKHWSNGEIQTWWIFRKPRKATNQKEHHENRRTAHAY